MSYSYLDAKYVNANPYGSSSGRLKIYIPEIMPQISMGTPRSTPVSLNASCYINASDCKPSIASQISTQNYATASAPSPEYKNPCYRYGALMKVMSGSSDFLSCTLYSGENDNSINWP